MTDTNMCPVDKKTKAVLDILNANNVKVTKNLSKCDSSMVAGETNSLSIIFCWFKRLSDACTIVCDLLGNNYANCKDIGNSVSAFRNGSCYVSHSIRRHSYDGGAFVLSIVGYNDNDKTTDLINQIECACLS